ncbi:YCF48-related protein [Scleromatobacter humisilvae]|uniref:YCF48-related protein n=1 Tax=Scleromatobacter humisilvae TaxID=2897159 RepID=A0A9X1YHB6_9BURK|nr:YCF48-related protein [Scleromatobacter humisilvae]MCK9684412.1 YCF48-related protein [Scleromatobacter humisilvae]
MTTTLRGSIAAAALCALLAACGGSDSPPAPTVLPASVAIANDARAEAGTTATFRTDLATTTGLTFRWDFGDGSTGTGATASHAYARPGTYQVTLAVANDAEDLRTATSTIEVGAYANVSGLACSQADSAGWCWQHAIVTGHEINDLFFVDGTHAWAVGNGPSILKSSDGGNTWSTVALDATLPAESLQTVRFYDAAHGIALDNQGGALLTADGGGTWTATNFGGLIYSGGANLVDYSARRIVVQASYGGNGAMSVDGGNSWSSVAAYGPIQTTSTDCWSFGGNLAERGAGCGPTMQPSSPSFMGNGYSYFTAGSFASDSQALVVGSGYSYGTGILGSWAWATSDGGTTWTQFTPNGLPSYVYYSLTLRMTDAQTGVLYNPSDLIAYTTTDGGQNWTALTSSNSLMQAYGGYRATGLVGNGVLWQAVSNHLAISTDRGRNWKDVVVHAEDAVSQSGQSTSLAITQYTDASNFVVAASKRFYVTSDGGQTFREVLGPDSRDVGAQYAAGEFSDIHHGKFLTSNGALLSTADGGRTWTRLDYPSTTNTPTALHFTSATEGWLVLGGKLAHSTDGGATWSTPLTGSAMANLQGMSWGDATHGWAWNSGVLFCTANGGATWTQATMPNNLIVSSAVMTGPLTGVAASNYSGAATTQDGGATWQAVTVPNTYLGTLVHASGQTVWSVSGSVIERSKDGGRTWQSAGPSVYSTYVSSMTFADAMHGWLVTNTGSVLRTIDGGDSWTAQPVGSDLVLEAVVAADAQTAWIITRDGQILATATAGN